MSDQVQNLAFRLYGQVGCPHCAQAEQFLRVRNLPAQIIPLFGDPVVASGIQAITGGDAIPVLISFLSPEVEVIVGYKENEYKRLAELFFDVMSRASTPDAPIAQSDNSGQASQVATEQASTPEGTPSVQSVSGDVDGTAHNER